MTATSGKAAPVRTLGALKLTSAAAVLLLASWGCSLGSPPRLPSSAPVRSVAMREYRFEHPPFPRGRVIFRIRNAGTEKHELRLLALPEGLPPIDVQLRSKKRQVVETVAYVAARQPRETATFAVDFRPGRYAMLCFARGRDRQQHVFKGMTSEFTIP